MQVLYGMAAAIAAAYRKHTHREHILSLPDTYIGSVENAIETHFTVSPDGDSFVESVIKQFNPGLYKLFDELLVNAHDHVVRLQQKKSDNPVKNIDVSISDDNSTITMRNNGESIDICMHPEYGVYIPQLIFGELLTSTNYDKTEKKLVGGKNGYGVKLVNIFAKKFQITIVDSTRALKYVQVFEHNMTIIHPPTITCCKNKAFVEVAWTPDIKRFATAVLVDLLPVFKRRVYDLACTVGKDIKVTWNGELIKFRSFATYSSWYLPKENSTVIACPASEITGAVNLELVVGFCPDISAVHISFVNGIWTRSGKHVDNIISQLVDYFINHIETKKKVKVKPALIKEYLSIFINCSIENPSFSSQTKEVMTTKVNWKISPDFMKKLVTKLGIVEKVLEQQSVKDAKQNSKTDGKKQSKIIVPKLDDAVFAGTNKSHECVLILTEGDSAKSMAMSGLSQEQRKYFGIFPLRGKLLNVKDSTNTKVEHTEEIANMKKIIGLVSGKKYIDVKSLRYGKILVMTDQDYDGSHIRGLLINMFHELWHELYKLPNFINYMATPIVKATRISKTLTFYTQYDYEEWKRTRGGGSGGWKIKYYKGLGTSTRSEAQEYFKTMNMVGYKYTGDLSDEHIDLAFNKKKADNRKEWLKSYDRSDIIVVDPTDKTVTYEDFVDKDLIHFSNYNLERSIPNIMDGLKTSQRKILFSAFKRNLRNEIKVAQFSGYVSEVSGYHHGEASLNETIIGMAQDFVGSNNIPWFVPAGQFGTRVHGGKDSASPRYIYTHLQPYVHQIVPQDDEQCLEYRNDDGMQVEPEWYAPIIPMILVNGCRGIGTGYSTYIPQYDPTDLKKIVTQWLNDSDNSVLDKPLTPYYNKFKGKITSTTSSDTFIVSGVWTTTQVGDTYIMSITELPIETWREDFKKKLELIPDADITDTSDDLTIVIKVKTQNQANVKAIEKMLVDKIRLTNMHLFDSEGVITKYESPNEILREYTQTRLRLYVTRKKVMLNTLRDKLPFHENVVRFITQQCQTPPLPELRRKTDEECDELLLQCEFVKIKDSFNYLLNLPIASLTLKHATKHQNELDNLKQRIADLEKKTAKQLWLDDLAALTL